MVTEVIIGRLAEVEEARSLRRDATAMVERLAVQAREGGFDHPVAASVARAARISHLAGPEDFADRIGVSIEQLAEAESGTVRFGDLPIGLDPVLCRLRIDLLSLADLERQWHVKATAEAERCSPRCRPARQVTHCGIPQSCC